MLQCGQRVKIKIFQLRIQNVFELYHPDLIAKGIDSDIDQPN